MRSKNLKTDITVAQTKRQDIYGGILARFPILQAGTASRILLELAKKISKVPCVHSCSTAPLIHRRNTHAVSFAWRVNKTEQV